MPGIPSVTPPSNGVPRFLQSVGAAVSILVALGGLVGSIFGYFAASQSSTNAHKIDQLQQRLDEAEKFASDIHSDSADMSHRNSSVQAMIAYVSLYAASDNVDHKFLIVETAEAAKDSPSLGLLAQLMNHDPAIQHPSASDADKAAAIRAALKTSSSAAYNVIASGPLPRNYHDVDLSTIAKKNPLAGANGQVVAALTKDDLQAWVFIGDVPSGNLKATKPLIGTYVQPSEVPLVHATLTTRSGLNLRTFPWANGQLGDVIGVAPPGTVLETIEPPRRHLYRRKASNSTEQAIWLHVTVLRKRI